MSACLSGSGALTWLSLAVTRLEAARERVNALNVFPVPDGDTGTNLLITMRAALSGARHAGPGWGGGGPLAPGDDAAPSDLASADLASAGLASADQMPVGHVSAGLVPGVASVLGAAAEGALLQALGNSGTIISQFLAAFALAARALPGDAPGFDGPALAGALAGAATAMRSAVAEPVEGTILTVADHVAARAVARGARDAATVAARARRDAIKALARTEDQLPALAAAGVVDAGACGLVVILAALDEALSGERRGLGAWAREQAGPLPGAVSSTPASELIFLVRPGGGSVRAALYRELKDLGVSLTIADSAAAASVHVHCDDPDAVLVAASAALGPGHEVTEQRVAPLAPATARP